MFAVRLTSTLEVDLYQLSEGISLCSWLTRNINSAIVLRMLNYIYCISSTINQYISFLKQCHAWVSRSPVPPPQFSLVTALLVCNNTSSVCSPHGNSFAHSLALRKTASCIRSSSSSERVATCSDGIRNVFGNTGTVLGGYPQRAWKCSQGFLGILATNLKDRHSMFEGVRTVCLGGGGGGWYPQRDWRLCAPCSGLSLTESSKHVKSGLLVVFHGFRSYYGFSTTRFENTRRVFPGSLRSVFSESPHCVQRRFPEY